MKKIRKHKQLEKQIKRLVHRREALEKELHHDLDELQNSGSILGFITSGSDGRHQEHQRSGKETPGKLLVSWLSDGIRASEKRIGSRVADTLVSLVTRLFDRHQG